MNKLGLIIDFDNTCCKTGKYNPNEEEIEGKPVDGLFEALLEYSKDFHIYIWSTRNHQEGGVRKMRRWFYDASLEWSTKGGSNVNTPWIIETIKSLEFPTHKPRAMMIIDDRCFRFEGKFPTTKEIKGMKTWTEK